MFNLCIFFFFNSKQVLYDLDVSKKTAFPEFFIEFRAI